MDQMKTSETPGLSISRDTLFLLPPGFEANGRREYCPECAELWGLLSYYPAIKESVEIRYQPIDRPRADMVNLIGKMYQNCPTLVLAPDSPGFEKCGMMQTRGLRVFDSARDIGRYYAQRFGTAVPRGSGPL